MISDSDCIYIKKILDDLNGSPIRHKNLSDVVKPILTILLRDKICCNLINDYRIHEMIDDKFEYHIILFTRVFRSSDYDAQELRFHIKK